MTHWIQYPLFLCGGHKHQLRISPLQTKHIFTSSQTPAPPIKKQKTLEAIQTN